MQPVPQDQVEIQVVIQFFQILLLLEAVEEVLTKVHITQEEIKQEIQEDLVAAWVQTMQVEVDQQELEILLQLVHHKEIQEALPLEDIMVQAAVVAEQQQPEHQMMVALEQVLQLIQLQVLELPDQVDL